MNIKKTGIFLIYFLGLLPLFIYKGFLFPNVFTKAIVLEFLVLVLFLLGIFLFVKQGINFSKKNYLFYSFLLFVLVILFTSVIGNNFYNSFFSNFERMDGIFFYIILALLFLLFLIFLDKYENWINFFRINLGVSVLVCILGLLQKFRIISFLTISASSSRIASTFGNAAFLATYLIFTVFISLILYIKDTNSNRRIFYILAFIINFIVLFLTQTRASILGFFVGMCFLILLILIHSARSKMKLLIPVILIIIIGVGFFAFKDTNFIKRFYNKSDASIQNRLLTWQSAVSGIKDQPIFGYGMNNQFYALNKYFNPENTEQWFDKTHNKYLDILLESGIIGFISYIAIFTIAFVLIFKKIIKKDFYLGSVLLCLLLAHLVQNFFVFDTIVSYFMIISILAFISFLTNQENKLIYIKNKLFKVFILVVTLIIVFVSFYYMICIPARKSIEYIKAYNIFQKDPEASYEIYKKAFSYNNFLGNRKLSIIFTDSILGFLQDKQVKNEKKQKFFDLINEQTDQIIKKDPNDIQMILINTLVNQYFYKDNASLENSTNLLKEKLYLSPKRLESYYVIAQSYLLLNDYKTSLNYLYKAQEILPSEEKYYQMAFIASKAQDKEELKNIFNEYSNYYKEPSIDLLKQFVNLFLENQLFEESVSATELIVQKQPDSLENYLLLAVVYKRSGHTKEFQEVVDFINRVAQNNVEIQNFIKNIQ